MARLLDLPPEVIGKIYDWLRAIEQPTRYDVRNPLYTWQFNSNALRPYTQAYRFRHVVLNNRRALEQFAASVTRSPALGAAVRTLIAVVRIAPGEEGEPIAGLVETLAVMWRSLGGVRFVRIRMFRVGIESLLVAVERGLELPLLEEMEAICTQDDWGDWDNPYDVPTWRTIVEAAPRLANLKIYLSFQGPGPDGLTAPPVVPGAPFRSNLKQLDVYDYPAAHEPAMTNLINSFPDLRSLVLNSEMQTTQLTTLPLLRLANLRELNWEWLGVDEGATPIARLDVRHFAALERVTLAVQPCLPSFHFALPPATTRLTVEIDNEVPLAALTSLVTPGSKHFHPNLTHIKLHLPYAYDRGAQIENLSLEEMVENEMDAAFAMDWTEAVSREGLEELIRAAGERGVELTGTCTAALRVEEAARVRAERAGPEGEDLDAAGGWVGSVVLEGLDWI